MELSNDNVITKINNFSNLKFDTLINDIELLQLMLTKYHDNYYANGSKLTPKMLNELYIECDKLIIVTRNFLQLENIEIINNPDNYGTLNIILRIINKQINNINQQVILLPVIQLSETSVEFLNRKIRIKFFQSHIPQEINNLKTINRVITNLIYINSNKNTLTTKNLIDIVEEFYIYPFWYDFDNELINFRNLMELFKSTFIKSHKYLPLFKPIGMFDGVVNNLYNRSYGNNISVKETFDLMKKNESIELLQYMWNQGETGLGYGAISTVLPKINVAEWIKIIVPVNKIKEIGDIKISKEIECLILSNKVLPFTIPENKIFNSENKIDINLETNVNVILHMHGGGFVAGSPHTHQNYLRVWAENTNSIIFSINYTKSPKSQFPVALNECYCIYKLLVKGKLLGFRPNKIILIGDSAGGNLVLTTTIKIIQNDLRIPDGILLAYPVVDCDKTATLSKYLFAYDILLSYNILFICADSYLPIDIDLKNELLSPIYASDEIIKKLPNNIFLISAGYCPLLDDAIRFVNKLKKNNMKIDHFIFDLPHGFLNFNHIIPSVNKIINQCNDYINFVLSQ